jgi:hypothetical protein
MPDASQFVQSIRELLGIELVVDGNTWTRKCPVHPTEAMTVTVRSDAPLDASCPQECGVEVLAEALAMPVEDLRAIRLPEPTTTTSTEADPEKPTYAGDETEQLLFRLTECGSVYDFLHQIVAADPPIPQEDRKYFYKQFVAMVARGEAWEREGFIEAGKAVFKYRSGKTVEADVKKFVDEDTVTLAADVISKDFIAEIIHDPSDTARPIKFLRYSFETGEVTIVDRIQIRTITYVPAPVRALVEAKALKLPTGIEEYGSTTKLLLEIEDLLVNYVALDDRNFAKLSALYTLYSWIADRVPFAPYLQAIGDFGQGKTTWEVVLGTMVRRGFMAAGVVTPSLLYRALTLVPCSTLICDEADFDPRSEMWQAIKTILNVGNTPHTPVLVNESGDDGRWAPKAFTSFGPKILATRRPFPDGALASRCLIRTFGPVAVPEHIPLMLDHELFDRAVSIRNKLFLWRLRNYRSVTVNTRERIKDDTGAPIELRVNAIALALLAACPDDDGVRKIVLEVATQHSESVKETCNDSLEGRIARALFAAWKAAERPDQLLLDGVVSRAQSDIHPDLSHEKVSAIVRGPLGFKTKHGSGYSKIQMTTNADTRRHMESVAAKYSADLTVLPSVRDESTRPRDPK